MNIPRTSHRPRTRRGFSLAELLISIGILSVGLSMAAAVFPTAMKEFERSSNNVLGNLICENGLALGKVVLRADDGDNTNNPAYEIRDSVTSLEDKTSVLGSNANTYPSGDAASPLGFFLFARKVGEVYQLVAVSYRNKNKQSGGTVNVISVTCTIAADGRTVSNVSPASLRIGSPLLVRGNGEFAKLDDVNDNSNGGTLDRQLTAGSNLQCFVFGGSGSSTVSPALSALTTRTGLQK